MAASSAVSNRRVRGSVGSSMSRCVTTCQPRCGRRPARQRRAAGAQDPRGLGREHGERERREAVVEELAGGQLARGVDVPRALAARLDRDLEGEQAARAAARCRRQAARPTPARGGSGSRSRRGRRESRARSRPRADRDPRRRRDERRAPAAARLAVRDSRHGWRRRRGSPGPRTPSPKISVHMRPRLAFECRALSSARASGPRPPLTGSRGISRRHRRAAACHMRSAKMMSWPPRPSG
jgi:hypothetical protein